MRRSLPWLLSLVVLAVSCDDPPQLESMPAPPVEAASVAPASSASETGSPATARPMMIGFTRDFCLPCQVMKPWIAEIRRERAPAMDVVVVNIDREKNQRFALHFGIKSVPTQVFVSASGRVEARHEGVASKEVMTGTLRRLGWIR